MKKIIIQIAVLLIPFLGVAQNKTPEIKRNTVYIEVFGQGLYNSFSFDRLYRVEKKIKISFTAGITLIPSPELFVVGVPVSYNFLFGQKNHHLELGLGFTAMYLREGRIHVTSGYLDQNGTLQEEQYTGHRNNLYTYFTPKLGYRFQKPAGGFFMRVSFTPALAGINRIGDTKGGTHEGYNWSNTEYFSSAAFFGYRAIPWAGISFGWTLKNK